MMALASFGLGIIALILSNMDEKNIREKNKKVFFMHFFLLYFFIFRNNEIV